VPRVPHAGPLLAVPMMRNWWHRLWCRDCRNLRPQLRTWVNDLPITEPFYYVLVDVGGVGFYPACPLAKARAKTAMDRVRHGTFHLTC